MAYSVICERNFDPGLYTHMHIHVHTNDNSEKSFRQVENLLGTEDRSVLLHACIINKGHFDPKFSFAR